jgi:glycogen synthase
MKNTSKENNIILMTKDPFEDNNERAVFFARGVIETIKKLNWVPDVIHLNGWMSSLIPIYLKLIIKTILISRILKLYFLFIMKKI